MPKLETKAIKPRLKVKFNTKAILKAFRTGYLVRQRRKEEEKKETSLEGQFFFPPNMPMGMPPGAGEVKLQVEKIEVEKVKGIEIPVKFKPAGMPMRTEEEKAFLREVNIFYNLIPRAPKRGELIFAYVNVRWDDKTGQLLYQVKEPSITQADKELIKKIKTDLEERLDIDFTKLGDVRAKALLREEITKSFSLIPDLQIDERKKSILTYYIERDIIGLGRIEPLLQDPNIEDISCDGVEISLYVYHRDPKFGSMKSNITFDDKDELDAFVSKLAQKCNKTISIAEPLLDGSLPDGSRVQATLGTDIARRGSNFTVRKFTEKPLTPTHMLRYKTLDSTQLAYLWLAIENGQSVLVSGGTATGKTCLLNALSLFIRPNMKIVSIEDTPELRLPHSHWIPEVARTPISMEGKVGEVSLFDLLKSSLRQRPDYIVLGEVRGKEAFVLFQQMATGHPSLATIHAASFPQLVDRLITPPISLPPSLLENINIVVFLVMSRMKGSHIRRADSIMEIVGVKESRPITKKVFEWKPITDSFEIGEKSVILSSITKKLGITEDKLKEEMSRRKRILEWMLEQGIFDYRDVAKVISTYYTNPERIMELVESA